VKCIGSRSSIFPREFFTPQFKIVNEPQKVDKEEEEIDDDTPSPADSDTQSPSRTVGHVRSIAKLGGKLKNLAPRSTFTFKCPTSVQCNDGGYCPVGDYCAIRNGAVGCCPIGSLCDAVPIPGCSISYYGICCDYVQGLIGEPSCSPTPGAGGQASGLCTGVGPSSPLYTLASCPAGQFICGQSCCPTGAGLICHNSTVPGAPFCNIPADVCPPGARRLKRQVSGAGIDPNKTDVCLTLTDTALYVSRIPAKTSASTGPITSSAAVGAGTTVSSMASSVSATAGATSTGLSSVSTSAGSPSATVASSSVGGSAGSSSGAAATQSKSSAQRLLAQAQWAEGLNSVGVALIIWLGGIVLFL
jgi:hypothetical protein